MPTLLIVDDEPNLLYSLKRALKPEGLTVVTATSGAEGLAQIRLSRPDAVVLDVRLPDMSGLDVFDEIKQIDAQLPVIIVTAYASTETAIDAMKRGAYEYLLKPVDLNEFKNVVHRALQVSRMRNVPAVFGTETDDDGVERIVGQSLPMQEVYKSIGRIAPQDVPVLILGESGTGKELIARSIFHHSTRNNKPFVALNCSAIPDSLLESELFGHERGAFTGADRMRIGKFEQCNGGTIFLDEIGDMSPSAQAKVLRLLQDGRFERVGGNQTLSTHVRIIAATNRNLSDMVASGEFRLDLYYRLNVFTIQLPPLRERLDDLEELTEHFVRLFSGRLGKSVVSVSDEAMEMLRMHDWPGNIRELQSAIKYALVHSIGDVLLAESLPQFTTSGTADSEHGAEFAGGDLADWIRQLIRTGETELYYRVQREVERILLREVLEAVNGNQVQASQLLGISRNTLRSKLLPVIE